MAVFCSSPVVNMRSLLEVLFRPDAATATFASSLALLLWVVTVGLNPPQANLQHPAAARDAENTTVLRSEPRLVAEGTLALHNSGLSGRLADPAE